MRSNGSFGSTERLSLTLLIGQSTSLGMALSLLLTTASTLFLAAFGAERLPYAYLAIAVFVSAVFYGLTQLQQYWSLSKVALITLAGYTGLLFISWLILTQPDSQWVAFILIVAFHLGVQVGFVLLGSQAGRLFDVRQIKRNFPLIVTGFAVGFTLGGLAVSPSLSLLGTIENLLLMAVVSLLSMLIFLLVTINRFQSKLDITAQKDQKKSSKPLSHLLRNRYVALIFLYQMLSAIGSQLVEYIFFSQSAAQFPNPEDLALFFGNFTVVLNFVDILFFSLLAGLLLTRYGMGFGLSSNPVVVGGILVAMAVFSIFWGPWHPVIFWLAASVRILDIAFTDGTTRTSINATYQALPTATRVPVQTTVEGIGVPVALGLTGIILLILNAIPALTIGHVIFFAVIVAILWTAAGIFVYRAYTATLLRTLSRRALGNINLSLDDASSLTVVEKLVQSAKLSEVRLGLDMLTQAEHPTLNSHLLRLVTHPDPHIRVETLSRLEQRQVAAALPIIQTRLQSENDPVVIGALLRTQSALAEGDAIDLTLPDLNVPHPVKRDHPAVRMGMMVGLLRYGGIDGIFAVGEQVKALETSPDPNERVFLAQLIGEVGLTTFFKPLLTLLTDPEPAVRREALTAAARVGHPRLFPLIINNLADGATRSAAITALTANGQAVLSLIESVLVSETAYDEAMLRRLVRVCGQIKGERVVHLLKAHLNHPDTETQYHIFLALNLCGFRAEETDQAEIEVALRGCVQQGVRILQAKEDLGQGEELVRLQAALDHEFSQARQRLFLLLSFNYEPRAMLRAEERFSRGDSSEKALVIETLDVALSGETKALVMALVDENLSLQQRGQRLGQQFTLKEKGREPRLQEIITDTDIWRNHWTRACAIYACGQLQLSSVVDAIEAALIIPVSPVRETAAWALHRLAKDKYQAHAAALLADPNPQVAQVAQQLG